MSQQPLVRPDGWIVVYVTYNEPEAYIVAGRLESEGIQSWVHQEPVGRAYGFTVGSLGEIKVLVHPEDYDPAVAVLDSEPEIDDDLIAYDEDDEYDDE